MKIYLSILLALLFTVTAYAQTVQPRLIVRDDAATEQLSSDYSFKQDGDENSSFQVLPSDEKILSDAELGNAFRTIGIVAQPETDSYGLMLFSGQNDFQVEDQEDKPFLIFAGQQTISGSNISIVKRKRIKKLAVEIVAVKISREDFERLLAAQTLAFSYGAIKFDVPSANLNAFRYFSRQYTSRRSSPRTPDYTPSNGGSVNVKGYYRKDGTYVKPHTRSAPRRKN